MLVDFYFPQKTFFPKILLPNSGCGLSTDAAYTRVNTVIFLKITSSSVFCSFFFSKVQSKIGVRIIHGCALYTGKYGNQILNCSCIKNNCMKFRIINFINCIL